VLRLLLLVVSIDGSNLFRACATSASHRRDFGRGGAATFSFLQFLGFLFDWFVRRKRYYAHF
jgi:hypothetical protein